MHKKLLNELRLSFRIRPEGPLLIKSGQEAGSDPTLLDMNFVRIKHATLGETVYLPGSSLKGAVRSYCEKIGRTVGLEVCDPLDTEKSCGRKLERKAKVNSGPAIYKGLCPICRIFGHTVMSSHIHFSDAYPTPDPENVRKANATDERDGVAIDRISGAVAVGPFQLEVVTQGEFAATITLRNFQLWQVGLLAVALRDMSEQRVPLGFARSRGLGRVSLHYAQLEVSYPGQFLNDQADQFAGRVFGVTHFTAAEEYGFFVEEPLNLSVSAPAVSEWGRVSVTYQHDDEIRSVLKETVEPWSRYVRAARGNTP